MEIKQDFKVGQIVDFFQKGKGKIIKIIKSDSGEIICIDVVVRPRTELESIFSKNGWLVEKVIPRDVEWSEMHGQWLITLDAVKSRKHSERNGGC